jgi:hypothetical protein
MNARSKISILTNRDYSNRRIDVGPVCGRNDREFPSGKARESKAPVLGALCFIPSCDRDA